MPEPLLPAAIEPAAGRPVPGLRAELAALRRGHRIAAALTALAALAFAVRGAGLALRPGGHDFTIYRDASLALLAGRSPLDVEGAIYLPVFAVATIPFALVPHALGAALWSLASLAALAWSALACARLLARPGDRSWPWLVWGPTALCLRPIDSCFANGQVNLLVFAAVVAGVAASARGRDRAGAAWVGLATALKLVPALLGAWLAARRRWKATLVAALTALALALAAPLPWRGIEGSRDDLARWWKVVAAPFAGQGDELHAAWPRPPGQSLTGAILRLATEDPAHLADRSERPRPPPPRALARARLAVRIATALLLAALFLPVVLRPAPAASSAWVCEAALVVVTALLVAPLVRKAHLVWLLLPFAVALATACDPASTRLRRRVAGVTLALAALLVSGTAPALVGRREATLLAVFAAPFWGTLVLYLWLVAGAWREALRPRVRTG